jgi:hypothetical protein
MDVANKEFAFAGSLDELKAKGRSFCTVTIVRSLWSTTAGVSSLPAHGLPA